VARPARRVAAIDIGTNSTRLLVSDGAEALTRRAVVTRLGEGVDASRRLLPAAAARVFAALDTYRRELEALGAEQTTVVATSAVRDATNGAELMREVAARYGFETRILSGDEEAALTLQGLGAQDERTLILDVGGGSTELIAGTFRTSLDIGSVRLAERFVHDDPPSASQLAAAADLVEAELPELDVDDCVGVGGTVAQLHVLVGELTLAAVEGELDRLAALPLAQRRRVPGLDPDRAPVIVTGALIVRQVLRRYGLASLRYSERDLLDGVVQIMLRLRHFA
jgi:exopolyphosphatase/guanosine-5'-triphosphate,3'-diphosphate pyrophosphatase